MSTMSSMWALIGSSLIASRRARRLAASSSDRLLEGGHRFVIEEKVKRPQHLDHLSVKHGGFSGREPLCDGTT